MLAREAEHRAKNILATVQATVHLSKADTPDELKRVIEGRIQALANVHRLFVETRWEGADLHNLIKEELAAYSSEGEVRATIEGCTLFLEPTAAQAIAVALHELATNAAKYGSLSVPDGTRSRGMFAARIAVKWCCVGRKRTVPLSSTPSVRALERASWIRMIRGQLKGEITIDWRADGLVCEIAMPV